MELHDWTRQSSPDDLGGGGLAGLQAALHPSCALVVHARLSSSLRLLTQLTSSDCCRIEIPAPSKDPYISSLGQRNG